MDRRQKIIFRFVIVFLFIAIGFGAVVGQILLLQTKERQQWIDLIGYQEPIEVPVRAVRGNIYDAEGRLLAGSMPKYVLAMDMRTQALHQGGDTLFNNNIDSIAHGLSRIFGDRSAADYKSRLTQAFRTRQRYYKLQQRPVTFTQLKQVKQLPVLRRGPYKSGLQVEERHQRVKPFGTLASRSIGGVNQETGEGRTGLESSYDDVLSGTPGLCQRQRVQGRVENVVITPARDGKDLVTTIDANLQDLAESTLRQRLKMIDGEWGCCILMEVKTGEIKAISNLDRTSSGDYIESGQHALQRMEPGSTFKTISLMACLEDGNLNYGRDTFHVYSRGWDYYGLTNTDAHAADTVYTVRDAMASSSNIALAKMVTGGFKGNAKDFVEQVRSLGIADSIPFDIRGSQTPLLRVPNDKATLARMAYGYSVELSPLQVLTIYNAIANDGRMIQPILVKEIRQGDHTVESFKTQTLHSHICSDRTLREVQECLHAVVWDKLGTASTFKWGTRKAQSDIVHIAGKTGTAQIFEGGRYNSHHHRISFVGYFPEESPEYS